MVCANVLCIRILFSITALRVKKNRHHIMGRVAEAVDFIAASATSVSHFRFCQNVVIQLVAIPPTIAEADDAADRFRFRIPRSKFQVRCMIFARNDKHILVHVQFVH